MKKYLSTKTALAGALALGWHGALFAGLNNTIDGTGGGDTTDKKTVVEKKAEPRVKFSVFLEGGITGNIHDPDSRQNFGRVFDDRSNEPLLNQATVTVERALAPEPGKYDFGFKIQGGYGSDGRFINTLGTLENVTHDILMPYITEAYLNFHAPVATEGGLDFKLGQFATILGAETIDPRTNVFYSHNYIFNFGLPLQHLGGLLTFHMLPALDLYGGVTRGTNTSVYDNNGRLGFLAGIGLNNLLNNKLTILVATHIGSENPRESYGSAAFSSMPGNVVDPEDVRVFLDGVATYKATDKLTSISELNYVYDQGFNTDFFGGSETIAYAINDKLTVSFRGECVHDSDGFYVAQFGAFDDFTNAERGGIPLDKSTVFGVRNTYFEGTLGVQVKPVKFLTIRPEVRYDYATKRRAFDDGDHKYSVTFAADAIISF